MHWQQFIKVVGRGKNHARDLDQHQAMQLYQAMLAEKIAPLQLGALLMAFRIKGESQAELSGFYHAIQQNLTVIASDPTVPTFVIPSYNGARKQPNLTPLLILLLRQCGFAVFCHMTDTDPDRITTAAICQQLGIPLASQCAEAETQLWQQQLALISLKDLCPSLSRLLDLRWQLGVRHSGHALAKLITPVTGHQVIQLSSFSHPAYLPKVEQLFAEHKINALLLQGCEGEVYANPRRTPAMDYIQGESGSIKRLIEAQAEATVIDLDPRSIMDTAAWINQVVERKTPVPSAIKKQLACCFIASRRAENIAHAFLKIAEYGY